MTDQHLSDEMMCHMFLKINLITSDSSFICGLCPSPLSISAFDLYVCINCKTRRSVIFKEIRKKREKRPPEKRESRGRPSWKEEVGRSANDEHRRNRDLILVGFFCYWTIKTM